MRRAAAIIASLLACALLVPGAATALDPPQAEYRSTVEPICKANAEAIPARIRVGGQNGESLKSAGRQLIRQSEGLRRTLGKLRAVPRPEADAERLSKWLATIGDQAELLRKAGEGAIEDNRRRAQKLVIRISNETRKANSLVVPYEFRHCVYREAGFTR